MVKSKALAARQSTSKFFRDESGYTLMELLVVLAILAMLAVVVTPTLMGRLSKAKSDTAAIQIDSLVSTVDMFYLDVGRYPAAEEGLAVLWENKNSIPGWTGPYVRKPANLIDQWGAKFKYRVPGTKAPFDIYTLGADGDPGGEGENRDVGSWPEE